VRWVSRRRIKYLNSCYRRRSRRRARRDADHRRQVRAVVRVLGIFHFPPGWRVLGPGRLDLIEDAVQDAFEAALEHWPFSGMPQRPSAWLAIAARNKALDRLKRDKRLDTFDVFPASRRNRSSSRRLLSASGNPSARTDPSPSNSRAPACDVRDEMHRRRRYVSCERIKDPGLEEVGEGLTGDNRHDHRQQHIDHAAVGVLRADRKLWSS
jgi:Sigma-70 region 2